MNNAQRNGTKVWRAAAFGVAAAALMAPALADAYGKVACRVELDRDVIPADRPHTAVLKVSLDAPAVEAKARPPVNLAVVLDRSGSMSGDKLERAKDAAIAALRRLAPSDRFSLVMYDHNVETVVPATAASNLEEIEGRIRRIAAGGNTALFGGVSQGASEVRKNLGDARYVNRIILLSDGLANVGPSSPDELGRLGHALIKEGISVTTVGVGTDYNEDLMTRLSQNSDGNAYFVKASDDLPRIFGAELGDVLSIVAKKVIVTIDCGEGVRPVTIVGRDGRIRGRTVELDLNQLYGGQQKYALIRVEIPAGEAGGSREVARARVSYENALSLAVEESAASVAARYSRDEREVTLSVNAAVEREVVVNLTAIAQDDAVALADKGKLKEAAQELKKSAEKLKQAADELKDAALSNRAEEVAQQAEEMEKRGLSSWFRKSLRTESYQERNQQMAH
jgi:Ca-activated chloride channel family protein